MMKPVHAPESGTQSADPSAHFEDALLHAFGLGSLRSFFLVSFIRGESAGRDCVLQVPRGPQGVGGMTCVAAVAVTHLLICVGSPSAALQAFTPCSGSLHHELREGGPPAGQRYEAGNSCLPNPSNGDVQLSTHSGGISGKVNGADGTVPDLLAFLPLSFCFVHPYPLSQRRCKPRHRVGKHAARHTRRQRFVRDPRSFGAVPYLIPLRWSGRGWGGRGWIPARADVPQPRANSGRARGSLADALAVPNAGAGGLRQLPGRKKGARRVARRGARAAPAQPAAPQPLPAAVRFLSLPPTLTSNFKRLRQ
eukprot:gene12986-biopygen9951